MVFLLVLSQVQKFQYNDHLSIIIHKKDKRPFDGTPFIIGIIALLKQFHFSTTQRFLAYLGQYVRAFTNISLQRDPKALDLPEECISVLLFLEQFCKLSKLSSQVLEGLVPTYIYDYFKH